METNDRAGTPANGAISADVLARLLERVEHIDRVVTRLERAADEAPALAAMATDIFDEASRRVDASGTPLPDRALRMLGLLEKLSDQGTFQAIETLIDRLPQLAAMAKQMDEAPGMLAMLGDIFDEWSGQLSAQGIDLSTSLRQSLHAALWLGQNVRETELERLGILLRSDVLEPHALDVVGKTGHALAATHEQAARAQGEPERIGPVGMLKALNDPAVQRSAAFLIQVARRFGATIGEPGETDTLIERKEIG